MTLVDTVTSLSERFLRDRTFELIVAPAIADLQHDAALGHGRGATGTLALLSAFAWGLYEDITSDPEGVLTFALLTLLPAAYYTMLVVVCAPVGGKPLSYPLSEAGFRLAVGLAVLALSLGPVIACYWPERPARRLPMDVP